MINNQKTYPIFKIIVVGEQGTGKTALLYNFIKGEFKQQYNVTVGVEFCSNVVQIQNKIIRLQIWDTAGQQTFKSIVRSFYKGTSAVLLIFSIDNQNSFHALKQWVKQVKEHAHEQACLFLVGTKLDIRNSRKVPGEMAEKFLREIGGVCFIETSAKTGQNIQALFKMLANIMSKKFEISATFRQLVNPQLQQDTYQTRNQERATRLTSFSLKRPRESEKKNKSQKKCC